MDIIIILLLIISIVTYAYGRFSRIAYHFFNKHSYLYTESETFKSIKKIYPFRLFFLVPFLSFVVLAIIYWHYLLVIGTVIVSFVVSNLLADNMIKKFREAEHDKACQGVQ